MTITINDFVCVADRAAELGCLIPTKIAILPINFTTAATRQDLLHGSEAATITKVFRSNDFPMDDFLPLDVRIASVHNKHFEWMPFLFISGALMSENPHAVSVALGIISNYATEFFKGIPGQKVKLNLVIEKKKDKTCKTLNYEGNVSGLESLADIIQRIVNE